MSAQCKLHAAPGRNQPSQPLCADLPSASDSTVNLPLQTKSLVIAQACLCRISLLAGISCTATLTSDVLPYHCYMASPSHEVLTGEALDAEQHPSMLHGLALP